MGIFSSHYCVGQSCGLFVQIHDSLDDFGVVHYARETVRSWAICEYRNHEAMLLDGLELVEEDEEDEE